MIHNCKEKKEQEYSDENFIDWETYEISSYENFIRILCKFKLEKFLEIPLYFLYKYSRVSWYRYFDQPTNFILSIRINIACKIKEISYETNRAINHYKFKYHSLSSQL